MAENKKSISMEIRADGSQARNEIESVARDVAAMKRKSEADVMAIRASRSAGSAKATGGAPADRRPLSLRAMDPAYQQYISDRAGKSMMMTISADGTPAREEAKRTVETVNFEAKKIKPWSLGGALGGLYDKTFRGLGGDLSRGMGLDQALGGASSGLGKVFNVATFAFTGISRMATFALRGIFSGLRMAGSLIMSSLTMPLRLASTAFKTLGVAAAAAAAGVYAGLKALRPAADMQQYQIQMEVLLKDPGKAKARLAELTKFAKETNYGPAEIIESANLMEAFGIYGNDISRLKLAGDAANAFGKDIREVVRSVSYLSSGRTGEAMESLSRIGVTRDKLKPFGVEFSKSGEMTTEPKKAIDAVFSYFATAFGGMTARQSKTWKGALQQLGGEVYDAFARGFKLALGPLTTFITGNVIPMIDSIGARLSTIKWDKILSGPLKMLGGMTEIINKFANPQTQKQGLAEIKGLGSDLWNGAKEVLGGFGAVGMGLLKDLGGIFEAFVGEGGIGSVFVMAWDGLKLALQGGAGLLKAVLSGFSREFRSDLLQIVEKMLPGGANTETNTRLRAEATADGLVLSQAGEKTTSIIRKDIALREAAEKRQEITRLYQSGGKKTDPSSGKDLTLSDAAGMFSAEVFAAVMADQSPAMNARIAGEIIKKDPKAAQLKNDTIRQFMGWDAPGADPMAGFNAQRDKFAGSFGAMKGLFSNVTERVADQAVVEQYAGDQSESVRVARQQARAEAEKKASDQSRVVTAQDINREFSNTMRRKNPEAEKTWQDVKGAGGFGNTRAALNILGDRAASGFKPIGDRLAANAKDGVLRAEGVEIASQRKAYEDRVMPRMKELRKAGWRMTMQDEYGRVAHDPATGKQIPFETERRGAAAATAREEYFRVAAQRRQASAQFDAAGRRSQWRQYLGGVAVAELEQINAEEPDKRVAAQRRQDVVRNAVSERMGLDGDRKKSYWGLVDKDREDYGRSSRLYNERRQAGDIEGADAVKREWAERRMNRQRQAGNLITPPEKPRQPESTGTTDQAKAQKNLGDMAVLMAQQKLLQKEMLTAMQNVDSTLRMVMGV